MSLVDSRYPELDLFLQHWRHRLNVRFLAGETLVAWSVAAPVALIAVGVFVRDVPLRWMLWVGITSLAAAAYALWRGRNRLSRAQAASWLDESGRTLGLFRAASESLDRDNPGPAGQKVLDEANRRVADFEGRGAPRLPFRILLLRSVLAAVLAAGCLSALALVVPTPVSSPKVPQSAVDPTKKPGETPGLPPGGPARELTPKQAAQRLFPEDARLAALAEQALASGEPGALDSLLKQNAEAADRAGQTTGAGNPGGESGKDQATPGEDPGDQGPALGASPRGEGGQGKPGSPGTNPPKQKSSEKNPSGEKKGDSQEGSDNGKDSNPGKGSDQAPGGSRAGQPGSGDSFPFSAGGAPGTGHSDLPLGPAAPGGSDRKLSLKEKANPGIFEYVLPGTGSKLPLAQALADSQRSAEAIINRTSPPLEFENTIRDYFLSLSQEVSP